ncbi:MAG: N-glycosylase/DNA lyase [Candidatus Aenigmatarchaeota archaeon]
MKELKELLELYEERREEIKQRLLEFRNMLNESNERIFAELAFCICTPQTKATSAWDAIKNLMQNELLFKGSSEEIAPFLKKVRFRKNKAKYIVEARKKFTIEGKIQIKEFLLSFVDPLELREWLVENIKGMGMKEASHFIRNIGLSDNQLAILDKHVLKNLKELNVIKDLPKSLSKKKYLKIEEEMKRFANGIGIPLDELDLLLWSKETGFVFH